MKNQVRLFSSGTFFHSYDSQADRVKLFLLFFSFIFVVSKSPEDAWTFRVAAVI